ncbi:glycine betaine/L-proline ABC transporter ATP-binding protein [soil metagenome]
MHEQQHDEPILEVRNVSKIFNAANEHQVVEMINDGKSKDEIREEAGAVVAVRDVSFSVKRGEFFVIMGLSGSGKSTLVRTLIRLIDPTIGEIIIDGQDITSMGDKELRDVRRNKTAMVFQHYGLFPHKTVYENTEYGLKTRGVPKKERRERAMSAISQVGLGGWENERPSALSGGMQQRVGIARALAHDPQILFMDEPFSGLDPLIRREMQNEFATLRAEVQMTTIFVTHDLDEALKLGDRIAIMRDGEVIQIATPGELVINPADDYVAQFVQGASPAKYMTAESIMTPLPATISDRDTAGAAIAAMTSHNSSIGFVLNDQGQLRGLVPVTRLVEIGTNGSKVPWGDVMTDAPQAGMDTPLEDLLPLAVQSEHPLAVVDSTGKLVGEISQSTLLQVLAADMNDSDAVEEEAAPDTMSDIDESEVADVHRIS